MTNFLERTEKIMQRIQTLASFSEAETNITRTYGRKAFREATAQVREWMEEAGLITRIDTLGNVRGRREANKKTPKVFVIASHIDSVVNAGKFDGPLGVIMGLDLLENIAQLKTDLPFNLELIAFCDEEGVRFHTTYLGSKLVAGSFDDSLLEKTDADGVSIKDVITEAGGNLFNLKQEAIDPANWLGYFEIHIEQGPVLYENKIPVAVVTAIAGQVRAELVFRGEAGHAGTVPIHMRRDALCAAAAAILRVESMAQSDKKIIATVGTLQVTNSASNVIPGEVTCSLDLRSEDHALLSAAKEKLQTAISELSNKRNVLFTWRDVQETAPVQCDTELVTQLERAVGDSRHEIVRLVSGAGHDAVPISEVAPVVMLFVRCFKGISHNPLENVEPHDLAAALEVAEKFLHYRIKNHPQ